MSVGRSSVPAWFPGALLALGVLVALAPVFGWAAEVVSYAEPLEHVASATGAADAARTTLPAPFPDYSVAGLGDAAGTLASAVAGTALTLGIAVGIGRALEE